MAEDLLRAHHARVTHARRQAGATLLIVGDPGRPIASRSIRHKDLAPISYLLSSPLRVHEQGPLAAWLTARSAPVERLPGRTTVREPALADGLPARECQVARSAFAAATRSVSDADSASTQ